MPFTPSHIVAVLPLVKLSRYAPFSAFAIASMVPDIPLFVPIFNYSLTHSISGLFAFCLPMGLTAFVIFESLLKQPIIALLPPTYRLQSTDEAWDWRNITPQSVLLLMAALVVGASTHVFWDSFTHEGQWGVQQIPTLAQSYSIFGTSLAGYKIFQYSSSLLGIPILALAFAFSIKRVDRRFRASDRLRPGVRPWVWGLLVAGPIAVSAIAFRVSSSLSQAVFLSLTRSITAAVGAIAVYALLYQTGVITCPTER
ncbi:MAG: DUF4184 family protein [Cyanobacteria bacterium P01_F01_bin.150]